MRRGTAWRLAAGSACRNAGMRSPRRVFLAAAELRCSIGGGSGTFSRSQHSASTTSDVFAPLDTFPRRHIGYETAKEEEHMLRTLGYDSMDAFIKDTIPEGVLAPEAFALEAPGLSESELTERVQEIAAQNRVLKSLIGYGYYGTITPPVIVRNVLENPLWYTPYTPYQAEISQGRLEMLANFQTAVAELTGLSLANASLLDEPTAAAEAMALAHAGDKRRRTAIFVDEAVNAQTLAVIRSRARGFGIRVETGASALDLSAQSMADYFAIVVQYPDATGHVRDYRDMSKLAHENDTTVIAATDLLALTLLTPPGEWGADIAVGSAQRLGVPMGYGGPHAGFFACSDALKRRVPGRIIGLSKDRLGKPAYRLALQTREQHIRRERATSNICTAQALLANMSAMYCVYHGADGLRRIAERVHVLTTVLAKALNSQAARVTNETWFDTLTVDVNALGGADVVLERARELGYNLRRVDSAHVSLALDETVTRADMENLFAVFGINDPSLHDAASRLNKFDPVLPASLKRTSLFLQHPTFKRYHSETEMLRYLTHLQGKDLSLAHAMIPLGSCTMKLNATTEMQAISAPEFANMHPFAPRDQASGYATLIRELCDDLARITGFDSVSVQPNSGANGEYTGLRVIKAYHEAQGQPDRDVCLIPASAHGTNPASAVMAGMKVVSVKCLASGDLDMKDLEQKAQKHSDRLAAFMVTYPSTFGVFEPRVREAIDLVHAHGGQVYMDGANMNAQIGFTSPGYLGADVCHLNLHKTFCIPHGGGGPGVGPCGVKAHLAPFLPGHVLDDALTTETSIYPVSGAPYGSAGILPISWAYIKLMGSQGLKRATEAALLNANYMAKRLEPYYDIVYTNANGRCAHEFILDARPFKASAGVQASDIAKRLIDYGFHAPTLSWPVANTLMVEPTESESLAELDRFCDAMISIRSEIAEIESGEQPRDDNLLANAPHPQIDVIVDDVSAWQRPYSPARAAYPLPALRQKKFWPAVARLDDSYGDMNLFCSCAPVEAEE